MARSAVRRQSGLYGYERALQRAGFVSVAGADEAGRGACAGPLVAAAVVLPRRAHPALADLADSKLLTAKTRDRLYEEIVAHATAWTVARVSPAECDSLGMHQANLEALRRAVLRLDVDPDFVLTDGFAVGGLGARTLAVWKGDQVAACISAASIVAKVVRDREMIQAHQQFPEYGFAVHKGYCTAQHRTALDIHGPCEIHRFSYSFVTPSPTGHSSSPRARVRST